MSHHLETGSCPKTQGVNRESIFNALRERDPNGLITNNLLEWHEDASWSPNSAYNDNRYECYICHREFGSMRGLKQHLDSPVHKQEIYHCPNKIQCGSQFKTLAAMFNHLESGSCGFMKFSAVQKNVNGFLMGQRTIGFY